MFRKISILLLIACVIMSFSLPFNNSVSGASSTVINDTIKILEIYPDFNNTPQLKTFISSNTSTFPNITVDAVTLNQFNSMRNDANGEYDIVYFGAGNYGLVNGSNDSSNPNGYGTDVTPRRFNDITNLRANIIKDMINSGQLVVFHTNAFSDSSTNIYKNFNTLVPISKRISDSSFSYNKFRDIFYLPYLASKKKLIVNTFQYPNPAAEYTAGNDVTFSFKIKNPNGDSPNYKVKLYIDFNRDGLYKDNELKFEKAPLTYDQTEGFSSTLPLVYTAPIYWKIEWVALNSSGNETKIKLVQYGKINYKGKEINANVLQIAPNSTALSQLNLATKFNEIVTENGITHKLGEWPGYYKLNVTTTTSSEFQNAFNSSASSPFKNLSKNFDMIIFGFADCYSGGDITNSAAMSQIWDYYTKGLGLMLTHDTIWLVQDNNSSFPLNISRWFVNEVGQAFKNSTDYKTLIGSDIYTYKNPPFAPNNNGSPGTGFNTEYMRYTYYRPLGSSQPGAINGGGKFTQSTTVKKINDGVITEYPFNLSDTISVGTTHDMYYTLNLEDEDVIPWYNLNVGNKKDTTNSYYYYYTYSTQNITFSGTGHKPNEIASKSDELKLFVNTVIKAHLQANHAPEITVEKPENNPSNPVKISNKMDTIDVKFTPLDYDLADDGKLSVNVYMQDKNNNYQLILSIGNLTSGLSIEKSANNIYKGVNISSTLNRNIKFVITDSKGATGEVEVPIAVVNAKTLPAPTLNTKTFQNTANAVIEGKAGESSTYANQFRVYITVKDSNGNVVNSNQNVLTTTDATGLFSKTLSNALPETGDFSKPYKVEVYQKYPATDSDQTTTSPTSTTDLYIDLHSPIISNLKFKDSGGIEKPVSLTSTNVLLSTKPTLTGTITDNDPGTTGEIKILKYVSGSGYVDYTSQPLGLGSFSFTPVTDIDFGQYLVTIKATDRAGNMSQVSYEMALMNGISNVELGYGNNATTINTLTNNATLSVSLKITSIFDITDVVIPVEVVNAVYSKFATDASGIIIIPSKNNPVSINIIDKTTNSFKVHIPSLTAGATNIKFTVKVLSEAREAESLLLKINKADNITFTYGSSSGLIYNTPYDITLSIPVKKMLLR